MHTPVAQSKDPQPREKILIETGDVNFVAVRFEKTNQRSVLDRGPVEREPAEGYPLPDSECRNVKGLSQFELCVSILEPGDRAASPKLEVNRPLCSPQNSSDVCN